MKGFIEGDPRAVTAGQKGGAIRGVQLQRERENTWRWKYPEVPADVARAIYQAGYNAGHQRGVKIGRQRHGAAKGHAASTGRSEAL